MEMKRHLKEILTVSVIFYVLKVTLGNFDNDTFIIYIYMGGRYY